MMRFAFFVPRAGLRRAALGLAAALWLAAGCSSPWRECNETCPLIGPNTVAKSMRREIRSPSLYMTAEGHAVERVWEGGGQRVPRGQIRGEVEAYLPKSRFYQELQESTDVTFSLDVNRPDAQRLPQKVAPYKLCVVSLCPTVVIMIPFDHGYDAARKSVTRHGDESEWGTSLGLFPLAGSLHAGTSFPCRVGMMWFRPLSAAEPQPVGRVDDTTDEIKTDNVHLRLSREQDRVHVTRLR